jgi:hypothetical protein
MTYQVPQALVFQQRNVAAAPTQRALNAHISGGLAQLVRYDEADERADGLLGYYDSLVDTCYDWPNRVAGGLIDQSYTRVVMKDALLRYFSDDLSAGDSIVTDTAYPNRIIADTLAFADNGTDYPRSAEFLDRDVKVGDIAKIRAVVASTPHELWTYVAGFVAEEVAAIVAAATRDTDNAATQSAPTAEYEKVGGADNCIDIESVSQSAYSGLVTGDINETYTITVTASSADGDATTALLRVQSASGNDDAEDVVPSIFGSPTAIGSSGLTVTWDNIMDSAGCTSDAEDAGVSPGDFIVGQQWTVSCGQSFTRTTPTSGGSYTGAADTTYIVEVTRGGLYAATTKPQITVTTTTGTDVSGPTTVSSTSAVSVGTKGVTIALSGTGLRKGDRFLIDVTAVAEGRISTIKLGHSLPQAVIDNGETEVALTLFIKKTIDITENRENEAPLTNWTQSDTEICLKSGITVTEDSWTDDGELQPLDVVSESSQAYGRVYVEYRAWRSDLCGQVFTCASDDDYTAIPGPSHPDNPVKYGVLKARQNANGQAVRWTAVCDPDDTDAWEDVLSLLDGRDDVYTLVPLTRNSTVWNLFEAHVDEQSSAENGRWRRVLFSLAGMPEKTIVDASLSSDTDTVLATVTDDPETSGTQYTFLRVPAGNANFTVNGVRAGDIVRLLYTTDGFGGEQYTERVVDEVISEDTLRLRTGLDAAINVAAKIEVWRNLTPTEEAEAIAAGHGFSNLRVSVLWPDTVVDGDYTLEGYFLCAAVAGLVSGVVPQQGLTRVSIAGFTSAARSTSHFRKAQLDTLAAAGVWVVTQDLQTSAVYSRHAITTAPYSQLTSREEVLVRNPDDTSYFFLDLLKPYVGQTNVTPETLANLRVQLEGGIAVLRNRNRVPSLGGQIVDCEITSIAQSTILLDHVVIVLTPQYPIPLNNPELYLVI